MSPSRKPGYWMYETSGVLRPAVEAYLAGGAMTPSQIATMRAYLRQWLEDGDWRCDRLPELRKLIESMQTRVHVAQWIAIAEMEGMDPL